jgi:hypothetical protein
MSDGTRIFEGDPARSRYAVLIDALGEEPAETQARATLARLVSWSTDDDITLLGYLIRRAGGRAAAACRLLLVEVVEQLGRTHDHTARDVVYATLPEGLVARLRDWAREVEDGDGHPLTR